MKGCKIKWKGEKATLLLIGSLFTDASCHFLFLEKKKVTPEIIGTGDENSRKKRLHPVSFAVLRFGYSATVTSTFVFHTFLIRDRYPQGK
jgi:hypothetical protein